MLERPEEFDGYVNEVVAALVVLMTDPIGSGANVVTGDYSRARSATGSGTAAALTPSTR